MDDRNIQSDDLYMQTDGRYLQSLNCSTQFDDFCFALSKYTSFWNDFNLRFELWKSRWDSLERDSSTFPEDYFHEDVLNEIFNYLDDESILNLITASEYCAETVSNSPSLLKKFTLKVNPQNIEQIIKNEKLLNLPLRNLELNLENSSGNESFVLLVHNYKRSVQNFSVKGLRTQNYPGFAKYCEIDNLQSLNLENCHIEELQDEFLKEIPTLESISFNKCNDNVLEVFKGQESLVKVTVRNEERTWNGFSHKNLNKVIESSKKLKHLVMEGDGTLGFFDSANYSMKLEKMETPALNFFWNPNHTEPITKFLKSQKGSLREMKIEKLPNGRNGGKLLKLIIEEMGLKKLHHGKTPLILNGQKQNLEKLVASDKEVDTVFEMFKQYPTIKDFTFTLDSGSFISDPVKTLHADLFSQVHELSIVDKSKKIADYTGIYASCRNVRKLSIETECVELNKIVYECLPYMPYLNEICLHVCDNNVNGLLMSLKEYGGGIVKLRINQKYVDAAQSILGDGVEVLEA